MNYTQGQIVAIANDILSTFWNDTYPVNITELAEKIGLKVLHTTFTTGNVSGMLRANDGEILIAQNEPFTRQRFSIGHEIGHYVLHYKGESFNEQEKKEHISFRSNAALGFSVKETEADFFAANLLMPESVVHSLHAQGYSADEMARYFMVSKIAMDIRLDYLGLK